MKIAFVYPHIEGDGGYPRDLRALRAALHAKGVEVTTILPANPQRIRGRAGLDELSLAVPLWQSLKHVDLVHCFGFFFPGYPLLTRMAMARGRPYIVSPMGQLETRALQESARRKRLFLAVSGQRMLRGAARVHVFADSEARAIETFSPGLRFFAAALGLHEQDAPGPLDGEAPVPGSGDFLCFGRLSVRHKGLDLLLDDFAEYVRRGGASNLAIAGRDWEGSHRWLASRIRALGLDARARLLGEVDTSTKWRLIRASKAVVYPTRHDGPPRPLRDALLMRRPILASRQANLHTDIEAHGWGCDFDAEPGMLADAMMRFDRLWSTCPPSYRDPLEVLSWPAIADAYMVMYRQVLADPDKASAARRSAARTGIRT